jgi:3'-phosphoadenosine 5'-phosphosulfate sulfotransferase (PAPS reductase)/FAD synthetase
VVQVLEEAHRLLASGGQVFLHDIFAPDHQAATKVRETLNYAAHSFQNLRTWAHIIGFDVAALATDTALSPGAIVQSVRPLLETLGHGVAVLRKSDRPHLFAGRSVALNFSGGKDSLACLYLLRPFLNRYITVYWLNTGDGCPETLEVIRQVREWVPRFVELRSNVQDWRDTNGIPSDLVPAKGHVIAGLYGMSDTRVSNRFDCCYHNIMAPMHARMLADGINMVLRGTKVADTGRVPALGWAGDYEVVLPLLDWSHADVFDYLNAAGAPTNAIYEHFKGISAPECLGCTAWWDDGKAAYLKACQPDELPRYRGQLQIIKAMLQSHLVDLEYEISP